MTYCRNAEAAVAQLAAEKQDIDRVRADCQEAQARATSEAEAARIALAQVDAQRRELSVMRDELMAARSEMDGVQRAQADNAVALDQSLRESKLQQKRLEEELLRMRAQAEASRAIDARLGSFDHIEARLRATEKELTETRKALDEERSRRDRAIALIKPRSVPAVAESSGVQS